MKVVFFTVFIQTNTEANYFNLSLIYIYGLMDEKKQQKLT